MAKLNSKERKKYLLMKKKSLVGSTPGSRKMNQLPTDEMPTEIPRMSVPPHHRALEPQVLKDDRYRRQRNRKQIHQLENKKMIFLNFHFKST